MGKGVKERVEDTNPEEKVVSRYGSEYPDAKVLQNHDIIKLLFQYSLNKITFFYKEKVNAEFNGDGSATN